MKEKLKKLKEKQLPKVNYTKKERLFISFLTSLTVAFVFVLFGPVDIYANNMQEFAFTFSDFFLPLLLLFAGVLALLSILLFLCKGRLLNIISAVLLSAMLSGYIDNMFISKVTFVSGDAVNSGSDQNILSLIIYVFIICVFTMISLIIGKNWKKIVAFLCVLFVGMNGASFITDFISKDLVNDNDIGCEYVLSEKNLFQVSEKENIIYILFDRFDTTYYQKVIEDDPNFFDGLDGFTFYDSATSMYTRTFPGVPYMISGVEYFAQCSANEYLSTAYKSSPFLRDLKDNGYNINIYADRYYEYNDAACFDGIADNVEKVTGTTVDKKAVLEYLIKLSVARYSSDYMMRLSYSNANNGVISTLSQIECESGTYQDNDALMYSKLCENKVTYSDSEKNYTFMYFHGSHTPFILDENCEVSENATSLSQTKGSFKLVYEYLNQLKELGVYDNATIVIAGDHGIPRGETTPLDEQLDKGVTTCIFFKPKNSQHAGLEFSSAPASSANIIPAIVKDAGIESEENYGTALFDLSENSNTERTFYQSVYDVNERRLCFNKYKITGNAKDIKNWKLEETIKSDFAWY